MRRVLSLIGAVLGCVLLFVDPAAARQRPAGAMEFSGGGYFFADETIVTEPFAGTAVRFYVSPLVSVGPEVVFVPASHHTHFILTGNLTVDLRNRTNPMWGAITPFFVVGAGLFQTRADFFDRGQSVSSEGAFTIGAGVRARLGPRLTLGTEFRFGWEPHVRANAVLGVIF
jgi:hypothetical protein